MGPLIASAEAPALEDVHRRPADPADPATLRRPGGMSADVNPQPTKNVFSVDLEDWYQGLEIDMKDWGPDGKPSYAHAREVVEKPQEGVIDPE